MTVSDAYRVKLYAESEGLVVCTLLTLWHPIATYRFSTDATQRIPGWSPIRYGTISRGLTFFFAPVEIILPLDEPESEPTARLSIANIARDLIGVVRTAPSGIIATIEVIDPSDPDTVQRSWTNLEVRTASYDAMEIVIGLRVDVLQDEPFPAGRITPGGFPRAF